MIPRRPILLVLSLMAALPLLADTPEQKNERIDPHLTVLKEPYQKVETEYYLMAVALASRSRTGMAGRRCSPCQFIAKKGALPIPSFMSARCGRLR